MQRPRTLALGGLGLGFAALVALAGSYSVAQSGDLMTLGLVVLGMLGAGLLGLVGATLSAIALRRSEASRDRGLAIAGLVVSLAPVVVFVVLGIFVRLNRPDLPEYPLEPPPPELLSPPPAPQP